MMQQCGPNHERQPSRQMAALIFSLVALGAACLASASVPAPAAALPEVLKAALPSKIHTHRSLKLAADTLDSLEEAAVGYGGGQRLRAVDDALLNQRSVVLGAIDARVDGTDNQSVISAANIRRRRSAALLAAAPVAQMGKPAAKRAIPPGGSNLNGASNGSTQAVAPTQQQHLTATTATNTTSSRRIDVHEREFVSPQVQVQIECQRDRTLIKMNFTQPFMGIVGAGRLDSTKCLINGNGTKFYQLEVSHNATSECETRWDSANSGIVNTLFIRFHPSLETGADLAKNVMCRLAVGDLVVGRRRPSKKLLPKKQQQRRQSELQ